LKNSLISKKREKSKTQPKNILGERDRNIRNSLENKMAKHFEIDKESQNQDGETPKKRARNKMSKLSKREKESKYQSDKFCI